MIDRNANGGATVREGRYSLVRPNAYASGNTETSEIIVKIATATSTVITEAVSFPSGHTSGVATFVLDANGRLASMDTKFTRPDGTTHGVVQINGQVAIVSVTKSGSPEAPPSAVDLAVGPLAIGASGFYTGNLLVPSRLSSFPGKVQSVDAKGNVDDLVVEPDGFDCGAGLNLVALRVGWTTSHLRLTMCYDPSIGLPRKLMFTAGDTATLTVAP